MNLDTILKRIEQLEKLLEEIKINREMLKGELENEPAYLEAVEEVKTAVKKRKQLKDEIMARGANQEVQKNIKDSQEEVSTIKEILTAELMQLYRENDTDEIAGRKFSFSAKLMPKGYQDKRNGMGQYTGEE